MELRQLLPIEFEKVLNTRDKLQLHLSKRKGIAQLETTLSSQINKWHNVIAEKAHRTVEKTGHQGNRLLQDKIKYVENEFEKVIEGLRDFQEM